MSGDFPFTSPRDDHICKAAFFERCLPGSEQFLTHQIEKLFVQGNEAFVLYQARLKGGGTQLGYYTHYVVDGGKARVLLQVLVTPGEVMDNRPMRDLNFRTCFRGNCDRVM